MTVAHETRPEQSVLDVQRPDLKDDSLGKWRTRSCWSGHSEDKQMWKGLCNSIRQQTEPLIVFSEHTHPIESPQKADGLTQIRAIWPQAPVEVVHLIPTPSGQRAASKG